MNAPRSRRPHQRRGVGPSPAERAATADWIASVQRPDGEIPWYPGGRSDPWDHIHAAMGLAVAGRREEACAAYRFLAATQYPDGGFAFERQSGRVLNSSRDSNHAAYLATGLWHLYCVKPDPDFLAEMWPTLERAIDFVVRLQEPWGAIAWAVDPEGRPWRTPLLTGSSSVHGSLVCAIRIAERLDRDRPAWRVARQRLALALCEDIARFDHADLPEPPGRHSMDWYYPILGGAWRGAPARARLLDAGFAATFLEEGVGCRCVRERPWYTVAETCEFAVALDAAGMHARAKQVLGWVVSLRDGSGAYWTGATHPDGEVYPEGERTAWTAATVLLAADALGGDSPTASFFRDLDGLDLRDRPLARAPRSPVAAVATPAREMSKAAPGE
ncbi:MAG TPA: prenyltransferase [Candidatus Binatia bacterium]|nr:prenyltransferase [Candidatus Binatia bacterium]